MSTPTDGAAAPTPRRDVLAFDRYDRWGLAALLSLVAVGAVATTVVRPLVGWAQEGDLSVPLISDIEVPALDGTGLRHGSGDYDVIISDPTVGQRVLDLLPGLGWLVLVVVGCWIVLKVMGDIGRGDPFQPRNVRRMRALAALLVGPAAWVALLVAGDRNTAAPWRTKLATSAGESSIVTTSFKKIGCSLNTPTTSSFNCSCREIAEAV